MSFDQIRPLCIFEAYIIALAFWKSMVLLKRHRSANILRYTFKTSVFYMKRMQNNGLHISELFCCYTHSIAKRDTHFWRHQEPRDEKASPLLVTLNDIHSVVRITMKSLIIYYYKRCSENERLFIDQRGGARFDDTGRQWHECFPYSYRKWILMPGQIDSQKPYGAIFF